MANRALLDWSTALTDDFITACISCLPAGAFHEALHEVFCSPWSTDALVDVQPAVLRQQPRPASTLGLPHVGALAESRPQQLFFDIILSQPWVPSLRSDSLTWGPLLSLAHSSCTSTSSSASVTSTSSSANPGGFSYAPLTWGPWLSLSDSGCTSTSSSASGT